MTATAGMSGLAPTVVIKPLVNPEQRKYQQLWGRPEYRTVSPGEQWGMTFLQQARVEKDAEVIDFGCGTGRGGMFLAALGGMKVTLVDFTDNCLDPEVAQACVTQPERMRFLKADLTATLSVNAKYGYCCDVMEHIPTVDVPRVLLNILSSAQHVFFAISTVDDVMGALIGEPLHLTVQPMAWWVDQLTKVGALVHWSETHDGCCAIYCTAWHDASEVIKVGKVNTSVDQIDQQVAQNINHGWQHVSPHDKQDREVVFLAGGPSMNDHVDEIKKMREDGAALVTCNGSYHWAIEHGLKPSAQIVLDARQFNARFTKPVQDKCMYLIASQVHPDTLEGLPHDRTYLWHSGITDANEALIRERTGHYFPIPGGSTVVLRSMALLRLLGYWRVHFFGFDSCVRGSSHHAYAQPENDREPLIPVTCGGRTFECTPWMVSQASEFRDMVKMLGDEIELAVYGDGLIAELVKTGARLSTTGD